MATIPRSVFRAVEWQLHNREACLRQISEDEQDAVNSGAGGGIAHAGKGGSTSDRTARSALILAEGDGAYRCRRAWIDCMERVREHFEAGPQGEFAKRYYGKGVTMLQVARAMCYEVQTIYRYRDQYVTYLALVAAGKGLLSQAQLRGEKEALG